MSRLTSGTVTGEDGLRGQIEASAEIEAEQVMIRLEDGRRLVVAQSALAPQQNGYYLLVGAAQLEAAHTNRAAADEFVTLPILEETLVVGKRQVETGVARVTKTVREREETIDEPLLREEAEIERVPINRMIEGPLPTLRYEGDILIVPLFEEVLVVEKRTLLKEELRISRRQHYVHEPQTVTLRSEEVVIERTAPEALVPDLATPEIPDAARA